MKKKNASEKAAEETQGRTRTDTDGQKKEMKPPVLVTTVDMLEQACRAPVTCDFLFRDQPWRIEGRLLTAEERDRIDIIMNKALPDPVDPSASQAEMRYDLRSEEYLMKKAKYSAQARCLALWLAYPIFQESPNLKAVVGEKLNMETLAGAMRNLFTIEIQNEMFSCCTGTIGLRERVDFI